MAHRDRLAPSALGQKSEPNPTSLGIVSQPENLVVAIPDAIGCRPDMQKVGKNRAVDPYRPSGVRVDAANRPLNPFRWFQFSGWIFGRQCWRPLIIEARLSAKEGAMAAYIIVEHKITDPVKFEEYRTKVGPMIAKHGGRYLTKGGTHKLLEPGHWHPDRVAIIEFPDMVALNAWYTSTEYQPLIALRLSAVDTNFDMLITVDGA